VTTNGIAVALGRLISNDLHL